jgi:hypothetical protein
MIVCNITTKVHASIDAAWLHWQQQEHIPEIMDTGFFTAFKLFRLLEQDDSDGNTYTVQYLANKAEHYDSYMVKHAALLRQKAFEKWGDKTISFRSVLEVIQ